MSKLATQMTKLARIIGGAYKTVHDREVIVERFSGQLQNGLNVQIKDVDQIQSKHIESYVQHRQREGISLRTLHNEMAALRSVLREAGRNRLAESERLSNKSLGLGGASREGKKEAIPVDRYHDALEHAMARDIGVAACMRLCFHLGLRAEEAVQANKSLSTWAQDLDAGTDRLGIVFGTKTGRYRETTILDREAVREAINFARKITAERNGLLIDKPSLKQAMNRFHNQARGAGLKGKYSPHSLRYAFARAAMKHYQDAGFCPQEARALVSMDLGHGDGRGRYVERVYARC